MFEEVLGIPAHPLIVHAAVVFIPLQILAGIVYAVVAGLRPRITWAVVSLAVIGPAAAWAARLSGQAFRDRLVRHGAHDPTFLGKIDQHMGFGVWTSWLSLGLGAAMLLLVYVHRAPAGQGAPAVASGGGGVAAMLARRDTMGLVALVLTAVVIVVGAGTGYYVFRTGDSGAHIVWSGQ